MNIRNYILDGKLPVVEPDLDTWARWYGTADRKVKQEWVENVRVSTVFLGLDHNHWRDFPDCKDHRPILFETMLFTNRTDLRNEMRRYHTWEEAEAGHDEMVAWVKQQLAARK